MIAISVTGSLIGNFVDSKYIGLLGLFPIYLSLIQFIRLIKGKNEEGKLEQEEKNISKTGALSVTMVTIANGGDNIGTYIPLFAALTTWDKSIMVVLFSHLVDNSKVFNNSPIDGKSDFKVRSHHHTSSFIVTWTFYFKREPELQLV